MNPIQTLVIFAALSAGAQSATLTVNSTSDLAADDCSGGACSLRAAIIAANATPAQDIIEFDIDETDPGFQLDTQHWRILVGDSALPAIEAQVVIDGFSQTGASVNTNAPAEGGLNSTLKIELRPGTQSGAQQTGITLVGSNFSLPVSVVRGLAISRFGSQIMLGGSSAHRVEGCYLGTNISGNAASLVGSGGLGNGVRIQGPGPYQIGGLLPEQRNVISGMFSAVTFFPINGSDGVRIQGNLIGTNAAGSAAIGNTNDAIASAVPLRNAQIGGSDSNARNIISATHFAAVRLFGQTAADFSGSLIEGNYFGTDVTGNLALGNGLNPSSPSQAQPTLQIGGNICAFAIGGTAPGQANLIAHGGGAGILADSCRGVATPLNRFYGNRGIPLDNAAGGLAVGSTPNDSGDADELGGNRLQNFPVITLPPGFLNEGGSTVALQMQVDTAPGNATYPITVHFYRGSCGGGSDTLLASATIDSGQAQQLLSFMLISDDGNNVLPLVTTAVDAAGNTSEFSPMQGDEIFRGDFEDAQGPPTAGICR